MTLLIVYLFIAIGVSFLCSILEAVLLSVTAGHVESTLAQRPRRGKVLKKVKNDLDQSISAILILNTFAHTMGAAGVGAQATSEVISLPYDFDKAQINCVFLDDADNVVHTQLLKVEPHAVEPGKYQVKLILDIDVNG